MVGCVFGKMFLNIHCKYLLKYNARTTIFRISYILNSTHFNVRFKIYYMSNYVFKIVYKVTFFLDWNTFSIKQVSIFPYSKPNSNYGNNMATISPADFISLKSYLILIYMFINHFKNTGFSHIS